MRLNGVHVDVIHGMEESFERIYYFRIEPFAPYMSCGSVPTIQRHGENAQNPLHDAGKAFSFSGSNKEMDMVLHNAEIFYFKRILSLGTCDHFDEKFFHRLGFHDHVFPVCPSDDMVEGVVLKKPRFSHALLFAVRFVSASYVALSPIRIDR